MRKFIVYWLPPVVWMAVIFFLSSRTSVSVTDKFISDFIILKSAHVAVYAVLTFLLFRAFYSATQRKMKSAILAGFIALAYAISDEIHQTFVPTRNGQLFDVFVDSIGIGTVLLLVKKQFSRLIRLL